MYQCIYVAKLDTILTPFYYLQPHSRDHAKGLDFSS